MSLIRFLKPHFNTLFRFAFSAALLAYLYTKIDIDQTWQAIRSADPRFILLSFVAFVAINFILLFRWQIFIKALGLSVPFVVVLRYFFIGLFGNLFLPSAIGGDLIKTIGLCRYSGQKPKIVASVLLDRLSGFGSIVVVASVAFVFGYRYLDDASLLIPILAMAGGASFIGLVLFMEKPYRFFCRLFVFFPKLREGLMQMHYDIALLKDDRAAIYRGVGMSCVSQMVLAVIFFLVAKALHQDVKLIYFLIFVPMICVASSFPSIGGLGVREAGTAYLLAKVGVASGIAVSISLINFSYMVLVGLAGGLVYVTTPAPQAEEPEPTAVMSEQPVV